ncbi:MAG: hypothetical protein GAK30_02950 [Paracidovorax wautersii]|uniref:Methyltransferase domain-containing protein n=1 Tax=Paracidovorax wautersii TaxID=1177982 RepID=A0A7V8FM54_9BURK|nr:MAG: hypothetical protein GAK30_02950 [Paracidovorax wautersii]
MTVALPAAPAAQSASPWVQRWARLAPAGCDALDVACGSGRHTRWLHEAGYRVHAVDRDAGAVASLQAWLAARAPGAEARIRCHDIEQQPWPFAGHALGLIVVTHYLWRPLLPTLTAALAPGGALIYETFTLAQAGIGKPSNPDFLLRPGELLDVAASAGLHVVAYEDGYLPDASPQLGRGRFIQRIAAVNARYGDMSGSGIGEPPRHPLL